MVIGRSHSADAIKRSRRRWRITAIVLIAIMGISLISGTTEEWLNQATPHIARVTIAGVIEDDVERDKTFKDIANNSQIKGVIVHLNTPGGTVVGGETLYESMKNIRAKKPVVTVMGDIATSAGYMVALGSNYIIARNGTLTGSIGVLLQSLEVTSLAQKIGVQMDLVKSAPLKGSPSPFERMSFAARKSMQDVVDSFYNLFIDMVVLERKLPKEDVLKIGDGRVFTGTQALELKLVDAIGGENKALEWLHTHKKIDKSLEVRDVVLGSEPSKLQELRDELGISTKNTPLERISLQGLIAIW